MNYLLSVRFRSIGPQTPILPVAFSVCGHCCVLATVRLTVNATGAATDELD